MNNDLQNRMERLKAKIDQAAKLANRNSDEIEILAISKGQDASSIKDLFELGQIRFGENYLQEALTKQEQLKGLDIEWHFVGSIQSNKTREIAKSFDYVHSVDRIKIATRLNNHREEQKEALNVLIQIRDDESKKNGVTLSKSCEFFRAFKDFDNLRLRGLMYFPDAGKTDKKSIYDYQKVADLLTEIESGDILSMGTSGDYSLAIHSGATMIRIGTELFGPRSYIGK